MYKKSWLLGFFSLISGLIFGVGLLVSGMSNPAKVLGFLDITGNWDPSLLFVMVGAISVGFLAFHFAKKMPTCVCGTQMKIPSKKQIDTKLIIGSALFGIGWGLVGLCPGPAIVQLGMGTIKAIVFVVSMMVGMLLNQLVMRWRQPPSH